MAAHHRILEGCTAGEIDLHRDAATGVFVISFLGENDNNPENRFSTAFSRALHSAYDAVEAALEADPPGTPAAVLTVSNAPKFFSNGIDPVWAMNPATPKNDLNEWNDLVMPSFARPLLLPCPTLCAINGHAFGAGLMYALGTDYRMQRAERGYLCAPEVAIGVFTPSPELSLFRHAIPAHAFYETVLHAKRWDAADAVANGVVHAAVPGAELAEEAFKVAAQLAQLAKNRNVYVYTKKQVKEFVAKEILEYSFPNGKRRGNAALPSGLQRHVDRLCSEGGGTVATWGERHVDAKAARAALHTPMQSML